MSSVKSKILANIEELFVGGVLLALAVGTTIQVLTRYLFGITFDWFIESSRYLTVFATFAGASVAVKHGGHFAMEAVTHMVSPQTERLMKCAAHLVSGAVMSMVSWQAWLQVSKIARYGMTTPAMGIPMWIPYSPIFLFGMIIAIRFLLKSRDFFRDFLNHRPGFRRH
ncbi:MAG TPA: TRAP transporter small permease [Desulfomicrobiaceae bacterium]|nr:TRAP transporter small permease [Desulfomicrobiaceae bacterium]